MSQDWNTCIFSVNQLSNLIWSFVSTSTTILPLSCIHSSWQSRIWPFYTVIGKTRNLKRKLEEFKQEKEEKRLPISTQITSAQNLYISTCLTSFEFNSVFYFTNSQRDNKLLEVIIPYLKQVTKLVIYKSANTSLLSKNISSSNPLFSFLSQIKEVHLWGFEKYPCKVLDLFLPCIETIHFHHTNEYLGFGVLRFWRTLSDKQSYPNLNKLLFYTRNTRHIRDLNAVYNQWKDSSNLLELEIII